jgi:predicted outer membrane repeat protein
MTVLGSAQPLLDDTDFINNHAANSGGALFISDSTIVHSWNNRFEANDAAKGGAIALFRFGQLYSHHATFSQNTAIAGGAMVRVLCS